MTKTKTEPEPHFTSLKVVCRNCGKHGGQLGFTSEEDRDTALQMVGMLSKFLSMHDVVYLCKQCDAKLYPNANDPRNTEDGNLKEEGVI